MKETVYQEILVKYPDWHQVEIQLIDVMICLGKLGGAQVSPFLDITLLLKPLALTPHAAATIGQRPQGRCIRLLRENRNDVEAMYMRGRVL